MNRDSGARQALPVSKPDLIEDGGLMDRTPTHAYQAWL